MMTKFGSSKRTKLARVGGPEMVHGVASLGISDGLGRWCQGWGQLSPNRWLSEYIKDWVWLLSSFHKSLRSYHLHHASAPGINRMSNFFLGRRLNLSWFSGFCYVLMQTLLEPYLCTRLVSQQLPTRCINSTEEVLLLLLG